eukprot:5166682-Pyramimonas_sp.AAC.1
MARPENAGCPRSPGRRNAREALNGPADLSKTAETNLTAPTGGGRRRIINGTVCLSNMRRKESI